LRLIDIEGDLGKQHNKYNLKCEYDYKCVVNVKKQQLKLYDLSGRKTVLTLKHVSFFRLFGEREFIFRAM
jgi:hypothetical protein